MFTLGRALRQVDVRALLFHVLCSSFCSLRCSSFDGDGEDYFCGQKSAFSTGSCGAQNRRKSEKKEVN